MLRPTSNLDYHFIQLWEKEMHGKVFIIMHDDTIIIAVKEERVTVKILKQAESPTFTKSRIRELNRGFVFVLVVSG